MRVRICFAVLILLCLVISGCIGRFMNIIAGSPKMPIVLRDTTTSSIQLSQPHKTIRVLIFNDKREQKDIVGNTYTNLGDKVTVMVLHDAQYLERSLTFIISDLLTRNGYNVVMGLDNKDAKVDYEISGVIWDFALTQKTTKPKPNKNDARTASRTDWYQDSTGSASIEITIREPETKRSNTKEIWFKKEMPETTAQEMATILVAHIVTETNNIITSFNRTN